MDTILSMIFCICGSDNDYLRHDAGSARIVISGEPRLHQPPISDPSRRSEEKIVADVISILQSAEKDGVELAKRVDDTIDAKGWTDWIAQKVLNSITEILKEGPEKMGNAMKVAYDRASETADALFSFTKDHPEVMAGMLTIIAVGILVILAPALVEALGFAELGPVEGSFAALWESTYAGYIPKGSLFSFFQRLGMLWR